MVKKGVYCSRNNSYVSEKHGGITSKESYFHHICFYVPEDLVGFYGGSREWLTPYQEKNFKYKGRIERLSDDQVIFYIHDPFNEDKIIFNGEIADDLLSIRAVRKSESDKVWLEDVFDYIGS